MGRHENPDQKRSARLREAVGEARTRLAGSLLGEVLGGVSIDFFDPHEGAPAVGRVDPDDERIWLNPRPRRDLTADQWAYALAHLALHLAFEHKIDPRQRDPALWALACELTIDGFLHHVKLGSPPPDYVPDPSFSGKREEEIFERLQERRRDERPAFVTMAGPGRADLTPSGTRRHREPKDFSALLVAGLRRSVVGAVEQAADASGQERGAFAPAAQARRWVMQQIPLLGALAAELTIVASADICKKHQIAVAAVDGERGEIFVNPSVPLGADEWVFVVAHEVLHLALDHRGRRQGRDPHLWNLACDFVINGWLHEMGVGKMPGLGGLFDPAFSGMSAETLYDQLARDPRKARGLRGLRGELGDLLITSPATAGGACDGLDEQVRRCLRAGLACPGRGFVPAGLLAEIQSRFTAPVPWDVELARWVDQHVPIVRELRRSYARASRRQGSTPDIPRPGRYLPEEWQEACTFGVVLDTSGSMATELLGRALGAIASYAEARDVPAVRVVACDAAPYDHGWLTPQQLRGVVALRGRGGTVLRHGVAFLCNQRDLPPQAPVMILTDGCCEEELHVPREHCFVLPRPWSAGEHRNVTLRTTAPVFRVLKGDD